jgi:electron-transferring-flavoprotein dehydrogenase
MQETSPRQSMEVDIACVGFGPASAGFLTALSRQIVDGAGQPQLESRAMPGMPLQVLCYERADDLSFGVSGVVTRGRGLKQSFPDLDPEQIPMAHPVTREKLVYLLDPVGASRRGVGVRAVDALARAFGSLLRRGHHAVEAPWIPSFMEKDGGMIFSLGQLSQWVGAKLMESGTVQLWPATPVSAPLIEDRRVLGVRLADQGTDRHGQPSDGFMPGMDIHAALTVVGDGPVGPVGRQIDEQLGVPEGFHRREWAVGMKMVVELPEGSSLEPGTVIHTLGYPEPEIFGFLYVHPGGLASLGIFVPSWMDSPARTAYRYLQHWMQHPYLWPDLEGGTMRSWGAKSLLESGRRGEPNLVGDGFARIGEGSGSTNVLTGSGVDEAWTSGVLLAEGVAELWREGAPMTRENLEKAYVSRRRSSWLEREARIAEHARDGFQRGVLPGLIGMGLTGLTGGRLNLPATPRRPQERVPALEEYFGDRVPRDEISRLREECRNKGVAVHDALMERVGWPSIPHDGKLLVSHQDALLLGGKVQAAPGYADHVVFVYPHLCERCDDKLCVEICSGGAIEPGEDGGVPHFDREKCVHCGACVWNCTQIREDDRERGNIEFRAGAGGLHSAEN